MEMGSEVSLNLRQSEIAGYERNGSDLVITLADGRVVLIEDYFSGDLKIGRLFISADGYLNEVTLGEGTGDSMYAQYGPTAEWGKWSPDEALIFLNEDGNHHRTFAYLEAKVGRRLHGRVPRHVGRGLDVRVLFKLCQQGRFALGLCERQVHDEHRQQLGLARVKATLEDIQGGDIAISNAQSLGCQLAQGRTRVGRRQAVLVGLGGRIDGAALFNRQGRQWEFEFGNANHGQWLVVIKQRGELSLSACKLPKHHYIHALNVANNRANIEKYCL